MSETFNSTYKDTLVAKRFISKYRTSTIIKSLGFFAIVMALVPYVLIQSENLADRLIPSLIVAAIGIVLLLIANFRVEKLKEANKNKYTVRALDYIAEQKNEAKKLHRRDLVIAILLILLGILAYFAVNGKSNSIGEIYTAYLTALVVLILAIAIFLIVYSKGRQDAYKFISENI